MASTSRQGLSTSTSGQRLSTSRQVLSTSPHLIPPGGDEDNPYNVTSYIRSEFGWSEDCLPIIIGQLDPDLDTYRHGAPVPHLDENGKVAWDAHGNLIRDFPFLPRYLSSRLEPWRYEAYKRMDPRLTYTDLWARMPKTTTDINRNQINNERLRKVRRVFNCLAWDTKGPKLPKQNVLAAEFWTPNQIAHNTTWEIGPQGIRRGKSDIWLPLDTYLTSGVPHIAGQRVQDALNERARLLAVARGAGVSKIEDIPAHLRPEMWSARVGRRQLKGADPESDNAESSGEDDTPLITRSARFKTVSVRETHSISSQPVRKRTTIIAKGASPPTVMLPKPAKRGRNRRTKSPSPDDALVLISGSLTRKVNGGRKRRKAAKKAPKNKNKLETGLEDTSDEHSEASDEHNETRNDEVKINDYADKNSEIALTFGTPTNHEKENDNKTKDRQRKPQQKLKINIGPRKNSESALAVETSKNHKEQNDSENRDRQRTQQQEQSLSQASTAAAINLHWPQMFPQVDMTRRSGIDQRTGLARAVSPAYMIPSHQYTSGMTPQSQQTIPTPRAYWEQDFADQQRLRTYQAVFRGSNQVYQNNIPNASTIPSYSFHPINAHSSMLEPMHRASFRSTMLETTRPLSPDFSILERIHPRPRPEWFQPQQVIWSPPLLPTPPILRSQPLKTEDTTIAVKIEDTTTDSTSGHESHRGNGPTISPIFSPTFPEGLTYDNLNSPQEVFEQAFPN
ncbi:hypothetical protein MMC13_007375 [Lambiella insularis]|nr:hypothetical protein [Lambiella insularis]